MAFPCYAGAFRGLGKVLRFENIVTSKTRIKTLKNWRSFSISEKPFSMNGDMINKENRNVVNGAAAMELERFRRIKGVDENMESRTFTDEDASSTELEQISYEVKMPGALDPCNEDLSHLAPLSEGSFNFAAYANNSPTIQELAKLGVNFHKLEKSQRAMEILLRRNFDELKPHIRFLHDCGVNADKLGAFITKNPFIFEEDLENLVVRIRYLRAHNFQPHMIARIVEKNPIWLLLSTKKIDRRLGHFQQEFQLSGPEVRKLATKQPRLITYNFQKLNEIRFAVKEEMGFSQEEMKILLLDKPRIFMKNRKWLVELFDYVHNTMKLPHEMMTKQPAILSCRLEKIRTRHEYLKALGKVQYDPTKPLYISPMSIVSGTDVDFCTNVAKTTVETYNLFLKSL